MSSDPSAVTLEEYATVVARLAEGDRPRAAVLSDAGWSEVDFQAIETRWTEAIAVDTFADGPLGARFSDALVAAQDAIRPPPSMTVEEYATLLARADAVGVTAALAERKLSPADWLRLRRHWARALGKDRDLARAHAGAFHRATERAAAETDR